MTPPPASSAPRLLLVDDEQAFVEALAFRLRTRGIDCLCAPGGAEALELLADRNLEIVLLDLNMPGLSGLEALERIKAMRPEVEVILLTGEADLNVAARCMRRGAGDYLLKPVEFDALLTSLAKAETRSRRHRDRLRAAEAGKLMALGALATGVGHEINNPLNVIVQRAEWLSELLDDAEAGRPDFPEMRKTAERILHQARRAGEITAQLLELAGKSRRDLAETDLKALAEKALERQAERAAGLGVAMSLECPETPPLLPFSPVELEAALFHLLRNALDGIEYSGGRGGQIRLLLEIADDTVRILVEDSGQGVAPEHAPHIFEPFYSTRPVGRGAGLGLTVCHSIAAGLRGRLSLEPSSGLGGSALLLELPLHQD